MKLNAKVVLFQQIGSTVTKRTVLYHSKTLRQVGVITDTIFGVGFEKPVYQHVIDLPLQGPKGITLKNLVWPAAVRMAKRECTPLGRLLNRLDPSFRAARFRGLQTNADYPLHPPEVRLVFHLRSSDSVPLRDDFEFEDGNFYRREQPRKGWSTGPVRWLMSVDYSIHKYAPVEDQERVEDLEKAYQWFLRYGTHLGGGR